MIEHTLDFDNLTKKDCAETFELLKKELVVVIKKAPTDPVFFHRLVAGMSHIANWQQCFWDVEGNFKSVPTEPLDPWSVDEVLVQRVTAKEKDDKPTGIFPKGKLDWHANLNGPDRADGVALQGYAGVEGTVTSWLDTAEAYRVMPQSLRDKIKNKYCTYTYNMAKWAETPWHLPHAREEDSYRMWIEQQNIAGVKGLYFYTNNDLEVCDDDIGLYEELKAFLFQEKFMYHHEWEVGDIVLSDQLLTLHRRPLRSDEVFEKRILHRLTFPISNTSEPKFIIEKNKNCYGDNK
jgi:hypothetical protein